jgi:predicted enzyme related to lactoylglutathione lyase
MADRKYLPGKFVWYEHVSSDVKKAQAFYGSLLGWKVSPFPMGQSTYDMILSGASLDTMIGGYATSEDRKGSHWISYVSVEDVDATVKAVTAAGGKVVEPPSDIPEVGRQARIADPQGAELWVFKNLKGDPPDPDMAHGGVPSTSTGRWVWNELHTTDPKAALAFYEKALGFSHRAMDMGPGGFYYILSKGGVDRGGVSSHLRRGVPAHWLPYVAVDDADATIARAKTLGGKVLEPPMDIPGVGRFGVVEDPTGAVLAIMKPQPAEAAKEAGRQPAGARA